MAAGSLAAIALWPLAWTGAPPTIGIRLVAISPALATLALALSRPPRPTIGYLVVVTTVSLSMYRYAQAPYRPPFILELGFSLGFSLIFVAAMLIALRTGRMLDETRAQSRKSAAAAAAKQARDAARRAHAGLLHDWVMTTLLAAARQVHGPELRRQAQISLAKLDQLETAADAEPFTGETAQAHLRAIATEIAPRVVVATQPIPGATDPSYPADAVHAMAAGVGEAVRNSARHAGGAATCRVAVHADADRLAAIVADDGTGFEPALIDHDRYGITESLRRLDEVPGGSVQVESSPTAGTTVRLSWQRPIDRTNGPADIRSLLGMDTHGAWLIAAAFLTGAACAAIMCEPTPEISWPVMVVALTWITGCTIALVAYPGDPLPLPPTLALAFGCPATYALVILIDPDRFPTQALLWPAGPIVGIYTYLCMRGRPWFGWAGQSSMLSVSTVWATRVGLPPTAVLPAKLIDFAPLLMATFFAYTLRPAAAAIYRLRTESIRAAATAAAATAASRERRRQLARLDDLARALLTRVADDHALTPTQRHEAALLEAHLRATLRAPGLVHPLLNRSVHDARERDVDVLLYDEHGLDDTPDPIREQILRRLADVLNHQIDGRVTIRIAPPGRTIAVTYAGRHRPTPPATRVRTRRRRTHTCRRGSVAARFRTAHHGRQHPVGATDATVERAAALEHERSVRRDRNQRSRIGCGRTVPFESHLIQRQRRDPVHQKQAVLAVQHGNRTEIHQRPSPVAADRPPRTHCHRTAEHTESHEERTLHRVEYPGHRGNDAESDEQQGSCRKHDRQRGRCSGAAIDHVDPLPVVGDHQPAGVEQNVRPPRGVHHASVPSSPAAGGNTGNVARSGDVATASRAGADAETAESRPRSPACSARASTRPACRPRRT